MESQHVRASLDRQIAEYMDKHPRSQAMFKRAQASLPGGNTRTGVHFDPYPVYADRGEGVHLIDLDGHRLLDFVNNNTALILGHAHPEIVAALRERIALGTGFSRPLALEVEMAEFLKNRVGSFEKVRFCSSGTEAILNAIRAARAFTGKTRIAKFEGAYHGMDEYVMVSHVPPIDGNLGPATRPCSVPSSRGLTPQAVENVIVLPFNDADACDTIINEHRNDLAAVVVDPLSTAAGFTLPVDGFLARLREITERAGVMLIFDEIVSFRISSGGAQETYGVRPDLTCLGKVVAGGTPGAVVGGRADVLDLYNPAGGAPRIPHSGTYNANPIAIVAGLTTLRLLTPEAYEKLDSLTRRLADRLARMPAFRSGSQRPAPSSGFTFSRRNPGTAGLQVRVTTAGSLFRIHFLSEKPRNYREAARDNQALHRWLFFALLNRGIYWKLGGNVSLPMETSHVDQLASAVDDALRARK